MNIKIQVVFIFITVCLFACSSGLQVHTDVSLLLVFPFKIPFSRFILFINQIQQYRDRVSCDDDDDDFDFLAVRAGSQNRLERLVQPTLNVTPAYSAKPALQMGTPAPDVFGSNHSAPHQKLALFLSFFSFFFLTIKKQC